MRPTRRQRRGASLGVVLASRIRGGEAGGGAVHFT
jgi:hypothetical protein